LGRGLVKLKRKLRLEEFGFADDTDAAARWALSRSVAISGSYLRRAFFSSLISSGMDPPAKNNNTKEWRKKQGKNNAKNIPPRYIVRA
jgi:hypothetical protein